MAVTMTARWDNAGTAIPAGDAEYLVDGQPIAEYDNWINYNLVTDIQKVIDDVINKFNANTILKADSDNTPVALTVSANTFVGRRATGSISAMTAAEARTVLNVENGATADQTGAEIKSLYELEANAFTDAKNVKLAGIESFADKTDTTNVNGAGATMNTDFTATSFLYATSDNTPEAKTPSEVRSILNVEDGAIASVFADSSPQLGGDLDLNGHNILLDTTPGSNYSGNGIKGTFTNGNSVSVAFGDVCFMASDGHMEFADADSATTMPGLYMALETISAAASGQWMIMGVVRNDVWNWVKGAGTLGLIYVSTTGTSGNTLTQTKPSGTGDQVQIVGAAISEDVMMFKPDYTYVEIL